LLQVRSIYQQALELNIENSTVKTKQGELNLKINELVADFKSKALKLIDAELYNEAKVFLNRAKTLKPTDTEIDRLLNNCK